MQRLLTYIHSLTDFSEESWEILKQALTKEIYKRKDFLLKEGEVSNTLFFIEEGYCKSYYNKEGIEKNINFFFENEIAASVVGFGTSEQLMFNMVACESLTVIRIDKDKLYLLAKKAPEIEKMGRNFIRAYAAKQESFLDMLKLYTAEERLEYMEKNYPEMMQRVPLSQLASFMGVARETVSRIRKQRMNK